VQGAVAEAGGGGVEAAQRAGDLAGDQRAGAEPEQQHEAADRDEPEDRGAGGAADGLDALGDAHGALGAAGGEDRHRGGEDLLVERVGAALGLEAAAAQGRGNLGAVAVVAAEPGGAVGVGDEPAAGAGDDHAAAGQVVDGDGDFPRGHRCCEEKEDRGNASHIRSCAAAAAPFFATLRSNLDLRWRSASESACVRAVIVNSRAMV